MLPAEILVWLAFLDQFGGQYTEYQYNVRLGPGVDPGPTVGEKYRALGILTTQLRLDALAYQGTQPYIFEVKRRAKPAALGQLTAYFHAWVADRPLEPAPKLVLVFNTSVPGLEAAARALNIQLVQVNADFSRLRIASAGQRGGVNPRV
jgi:hypothetical protein